MGAKVDYKGRKIGRLQVIGPAANINGRPAWYCKCDCGNDFVCKSGLLGSKAESSCGCAVGQARKVKDLDMLGKKFGRWTVISNAGPQEDNYIRWNCICECGAEGTVEGSTLRLGKSKSCGCLHSEIVKNLHLDGKSPHYKGGPLAVIFRQSSKEAAERGYCWELSYEEFLQLVQANCVYCGAPPALDALGGLRNGIDRQNNKEGYTKNNSVSCCYCCNRLKMKADVDSFLDRAKKINKIWGSKYG